MNIWNHYYTPETIQDALRALVEVPGSVRLIAGGTDLLLELQQGQHPPVDALVDVNHIPELQVLEVQQQTLVIGAAVPLKKVSTSPLVREHAQALTEASGLVGGPQVRNAATLGGNVSHALPAADGTISLMSLDTRVKIASASGMRIVPMAEIFAGPGKSTLDSRGDLVVAFLIPICKAGQASGFSRVMRPQGVALPILNMSIWLDRKGDQIVDSRIAVGPGGPVPRRCSAVEDLLRGQIHSAGLLDAALDTLLQEVRFRTSPQRATAEYRKLLAGALLHEVWQKVWQRAGAAV